MVCGHPLVLSPVVQVQLAVERVALEGLPLVAGAGSLALGDLAVAHPLVLSPVVQAQLAGEGPSLVETDTLVLGDLAVAHPPHDSKWW